MTAKVAIVIPVLNRAQLVQRAIVSVLDQQIDGIEIIAVDGGSTDGTQDAISSFADVRLLHAKNSSIYEALNIGIRAAQATLIGHLNSDDKILPAALQKAIDAAASHPDVDMVRGRALHVIRREGEDRPLPAHNDRVAHNPDVAGVLFAPPAINTCFVRAAVYSRLGLYDETLRIAADREWLLRAVLSGATIFPLAYPVYEYLSHPDSMTISAERSNEAKYAREHLTIAERYLVRPLPPDVARIIRSWHAQEVVRLLVRGGAGEHLGSDIARAFRVSPLWPIRSVGPMLRFLAGRLQRGAAA